MICIRKHVTSVNLLNSCNCNTVFLIGLYHRRVPDLIEFVVSHCLQVLRTCPGLRLASALLDVQTNASSVTLPLGLLVSTLIDAAAEDVAVQVLMDVYDTRLERTYEKVIFL